MVSADEAAELVPGLRTDTVVGGAWCAADGYFDRPQGVVEAFARGLEIRLGEVGSLDELHAETIVVAAGADTPRLLPQLPIVREDRYLFYSDPIQERLLEPLVVSPARQFAAKQLGNGRVLASDLGARGDASGAEQWRANIRAAIDELLPILTYVSLPLLVHGEYDVTPDHQPILGQVDERRLRRRRVQRPWVHDRARGRTDPRRRDPRRRARRGARRSRRGAVRRGPPRARAATRVGLRR